MEKMIRNLEHGVALHEVGRHLTGVYPPDWKGRKFAKPINCWVTAPDRTMLVELLQIPLIGTGRRGGDRIPARMILEKFISRDHPGGVDYARIRHSSGGPSLLRFKTYEQPRAAWQGAAVDVLLFFRRAPGPIFQEGMSRLMATCGMAIQSNA